MISSLSSLKMASSTFDSYATKVCLYSERKPGTYDSNALNSIILSLPFAEAHVAVEDLEIEKLPRLGETLRLRDHLQGAFFDVVRLPDVDLHMFTVPILIRQAFLERLEGWREWRTLAAFLSGDFLQPAVVFKNTPIPIKTGPFETETYYLADVRILFCRQEPFTWSAT